MNQTVQKPKCIGFIMDGNRRWAREHRLDSLSGHTQGREAFHAMVRYLRDSGIQHGIFYAFSTENWNRSEREVSYLMKLLESEVKELLRGVDEKQVRVRIVGEKEKLSEELKSLITELEEKSSVYSDTTIWIALSYGGRTEIIDAVNKAIEKGEPITEASFCEHLWTRDMPDPDLIIRTGGEKRLSNFLPWQSVYSEFFFVDTYWPDFGVAAFEGILEEYATRERRRGR